MATLAEFLQRNSVVCSETLPLVHSTIGYHFKRIMATGKIIAQPCDVFSPDRINYFFVGRPAYKISSDFSDSEYWELPVCFVFEFTAVANPKRIFPFDSGAFHNSLYPPFINKMPMSEFDVASCPDGVSRIIGAFFGSPGDYFGLNSKEKTRFEGEFSLRVFDEEIRALHKLALQSSSEKYDDRRFSIEVQSDSDIDLSITKPLAVIAPNTYLDDEDFRNHVELVWGARPIRLQRIGYSRLIRV